MQIVLFGPPGIGKGTQSALLAERLELAHVSTGEILRAAIKEGTPVGMEAKSYITAGKLVPGAVVRRLAEDRLRELGCQDFILDGYPRTVEQAEWLTEFLETEDAQLDAVISMQGPAEVIVERLSRRRVNKVTGESYHLDFRPPPPGVDPDLIIQRTDDQPEAIRKRLQVYQDETAPVEAYFRARGRHFVVDGVGDVEEVYGRILGVLREAVPSFSMA